MIQICKSTTRIMRMVAPELSKAARIDLANMMANMLPACDEMYLCVCGRTASLITSYVHAVYVCDTMPDCKGYVVRRVTGGYFIYDID